jgi:hypothetical protein
MKVQLKASKSPRVVTASEYKFPGSVERAVGSNGELNASSKKDLLSQQMKFLSAHSQGQFTSQEDVETSRELVAAAFNDENAHRILGERMADSLQMTGNRQGFMRKYLARIDVAQGSIPRFPVRMKNVTASYSISPTKIGHQIVRDKWIMPPEITIVARPFIPQTELNQSSGDVLQEKFIEAQEATMVAEDRMWYNQVNALVGVSNNLNIISGQLTPYGLMASRASVDRWGLKALHMLLASDLYQDIIGNSEFYSAIDPVARHELLLTGELATMYGMTLTSDAYRHPEHRVLSQGEFFVISDSLNHGAYSDRGGVQSQPIDISTEGVPGRGWVIHEPLAMAIANSRSVSKGIRR